MTGNDDSSRKLQPLLANLPQPARAPLAMSQLPPAKRTPPPARAMAPAKPEVPEDEADTQDMPLLELSASEEDTSPWPRNVPGNEAGLGFLRSPSSAGAWEPVTSVVLAALSVAERGVLYEDVLPPHLIGLRTAVVFRWRLSAMLATAPRSLDVPMDRAALEAVLVESDDVLNGLRMPDGLPPPAKAGFDSARGSVARDVVTLADLTQKLQPPSPELLAEQAAQSERAKAAAQSRVAATAKKVTFEPVKAKPAKKVHVLYAVGLVTFLAGGAYHLIDYLHRPPPPLPSPVYLDVPEGALGSKDLQHDVLTFQAIPGRMIRPEALEALRAKATAEGKVFRELSPGFYFVGPAARLYHPPGAKP